MRSGVVLAAGDVVQEEEGGSAAADDIVDTHGHAVDAHGVMLVHQEGQLQLGTHAVGAGHQHRLLHAGQIRGKHAAEAAQGAHHPGDIGGLHHGLDALHRLISGGDVHPGGGVGLRMGVFHLKNLQITVLKPRRLSAESGKDNKESAGESISPQDIMTPGRGGQGRLSCGKARGYRRGSDVASRGDIAPLEGPYSLPFQQ